MFDWRALAAIALGGGFGSVLRYLVTIGMTQRLGPGFPWSTLTINIAGSLIIGVVAELSQTRSVALSPTTRLFLMTGILGGFTTFSTFSLDVVTLAGERAGALALLYAGGSVVLGFVAAYAGMVVVRALNV
jgi:CrcB protein